eukprot:3703633-Amphidinium_carterae.1
MAKRGARKEISRKEFQQDYPALCYFYAKARTLSAEDLSERDQLHKHNMDKGFEWNFEKLELYIAT